MKFLLILCIVLSLFAPSVSRCQEEAYIGLYTDTSRNSSIFYPTTNVEVFVMCKPIEAGITALDYRITSTNSGVFFHSDGCQIIHHTRVCGGDFEISDPPTRCSWHVEFCSCMNQTTGITHDGWFVVNVINLNVENFDGAFLLLEPVDDSFVVYGCDSLTEYPLVPVNNLTLWGPVGTEENSWGAIKSMYR